MVTEAKEQIPQPENGEKRLHRFIALFGGAVEVYREGKSILERAGEDEALLGSAFIKLHASWEQATQKFREIFSPEDTAIYSSLGARDYLAYLSGQRVLSSVDDNALYSFLQDRNKYVHEGVLPLERRHVEGYLITVNSVLKSVIEHTLSRWEDLATSLDLSKRREVVVSILKDDIAENGVWAEEFDWQWLYFGEWPSRKAFIPPLALTDMDIVGCDKEEVSTKEPGNIVLLGRIFLAEDLEDPNALALDDILKHNFSIVLFIPKKYGQEFRTKLKGLENRVSLVSYHYDSGANLQLLSRQLLQKKGGL